MTSVWLEHGMATFQTIIFHFRSSGAVLIQATQQHDFNSHGNISSTAIKLIRPQARRPQYSKRLLFDFMRRSGIPSTASLPFDFRSDLLIIQAKQETQWRETIRCRFATCSLCRRDKRLRRASRTRASDRSSSMQTPANPRIHQHVDKPASYIALVQYLRRQWRVVLNW